MAQKATDSVLQAFLEALRQDTHASLSSTGELISELQERDVENAREIAVRLQQELYLCDSHRPSYFLGQTSRSCTGRMYFCNAMSFRRGFLHWSMNSSGS